MLGSSMSGLGLISDYCCCFKLARVDLSFINTAASTTIPQHLHGDDEDPSSEEADAAAVECLDDVDDADGVRAPVAEGVAAGRVPMIFPARWGGGRPPMPSPRSASAYNPPSYPTTPHSSPYIHLSPPPMTHRRHPSAAAGGGALLILLAVGAAVAQPSPASNDNSNSNNGNNNNNVNNNPYGFSPNFNPSMAIVIVVLVSAFFFLGFFSIYIRQCGGAAGSDSVNPLTGARGGGAARSRHQRGLDPEVLATFPTLVYSEVKVLKIGKGDLECAVCLSEFEEDETLRLLPGCSHVFHPDCIDSWLASHVTCPVCRSNLAEVHVAEPPTPAADPPEQVAVEVDPGEEERKEDLAELARIASRRRGGAPLPRSHSTGHSMVDQAGSRDRFTLRLPEHIRKEIVAAGKMQRAESLRGFPLHREGSSRRGYRAGGGAAEGSNRGGRSIRLGRTERWPSILLRNFSARLPAWGRRWDREGSMKYPGGEDSSMKGRPSSFRGGGAPAGVGGEEASAAATGADRV